MPYFLHPLFSCPLCREPLQQNSQGLACANRHQFDRAREGYFNLLPVQFKNSKEPGDAKQQLAARRQFLQSGYFSPLLEALKNILIGGIHSLLDIGCGEGYFTNWLAQHLAHAEVYGIDIAKTGVRMAAKVAAANSCFAVASSHSLPFSDNSMDAIIRIYAPSKDDELVRTLKESGLLVIVTPGENHLMGLRREIYSQIKPHQLPVTPTGFHLQEQISITYALDIPEGEPAAALLEMTPFAWKLTPEKKRAYAAAGIRDTADFCISLYRKSSI